MIDKSRQKILQYPNPILLKKSHNVSKNYPDLKKLVLDLKRLVKFNSTKDIKLVGLSAPQIGVNLKVFVYWDEKCNDYKEVINPELIYSSKETSVEWEGCASLGTGENSLFGPVRRSKICQIKFFDTNWQEKILVANDYLSHVILHELDHLDGILFIERIIDPKYLMTAKELDILVKKNNGKYPEFK